MASRASQREISWRRSARLMGGIWLFALALFLLQLILPDRAGREPVQVVLFLVLILLALPSTLLLLAAWAGPGRSYHRLSALCRRRRRHRFLH